MYCILSVKIHNYTVIIIIMAVQLLSVAILRVIVFILSVFLLLCPMCIIYVHFKGTDQMDLNDVAKEFVRRNISYFGNF